MRRADDKPDNDYSQPVFHVGFLLCFTYSVNCVFVFSSIQMKEALRKSLFVTPAKAGAS
jgi:hypothetical protein